MLFFCFFLLRLGTDSACLRDSIASGCRGETREGLWSFPEKDAFESPATSCNTQRLEETGRDRQWPASYHRCEGNVFEVRIINACHDS